MGKKSHTSHENCDFNGDKLVENGKREITIFKIQKFSGNVIWETGFVKRNLRKMRPWATIFCTKYFSLPDSHFDMRETGFGNPISCGNRDLNGENKVGNGN